MTDYDLKLEMEDQNSEKVIYFRIFKKGNEVYITDPDPSLDEATKRAREWVMNDIKKDLEK